MNSAFRPLAAFLALSLATAAPALAATDFRPADAKPITTTDIQLVQQAALVVPRDRITATLRVILRGPDAARSRSRSTAAWLRRWPRSRTRPP